MIKKIIYVVVALMSYLSANALTFEKGGIYYRSVAGGWEVTYKGQAWNVVDEYRGYVVIPSRVKTYDAVGNELDFQVVSIGESAFAGSSITRVSIPATVKTIGQGAFAKCENLTELEIPSSVASIGTYICDSSTALEKVTLSQQLSEIPDCSFSGCKKLKEITLDGIKRIGGYAFSGCEGLKMLTLPASLEYVGPYAFQRCKNLKTLNYNAVNCTFDAAYGKPTFENSGIERLLVGDGVTVISSNAFQFCSSIKALRLPETLVNIGSRAFAYCTGLRAVVFPSSLKSIDALAFMHCENLYCVTSKALTPPAANSNTFSVIQDGAVLYVDRKSVDLYANSSGWDTFYKIRKCSKKDAFVYELEGNGEGTVSLVDYDDYLAETVVVPSSVMVDGQNYKVCSLASPFVGCSNVRSLTLPSSLQSGGRYDGLTNLEVLICERNYPPTVVEWAFNDLPENCVLQVPAGCTSVYAAAEGWSRFTKILGVDNVKANNQGIKVTANGVVVESECDWVEIYSVSGKLVKKISNPAAGSAINIDNAGVYIVRTPIAVAKVVIR